MGNPIRRAELVRIELVLDGVTYEIELAAADKVDLGMGELGAQLSFEVDTVRQLDELEVAWRDLPTGNATVKLEAHGRLVKALRRKSE